eukprot:CAMPEP_0170496524 /NCGR_PEP_ID=MMETSP0208-20121228/21924_1 /TAXON_ID=197538 /ORGANISM="Strombidium inclinatum, Strain S3" /LENGTH=67 /DNA_ID=CAMNT_0010773091 /DNA_START=1076 /DNA_END=1279 /DNA_ORIENTATION=-
MYYFLIQKCSKINPEAPKFFLELKAQEMERPPSFWRPTYSAKVFVDLNGEGSIKGWIVKIYDQASSI